MGERIGGWRMGNGGMGRKRERKEKGRRTEERAGEAKKKKKKQQQHKQEHQAGKAIAVLCGTFGCYTWASPHPCTHPPTLLAAGHPFTHTKRVLFEAA